MSINKIPDFPSYTGFALFWIVAGSAACLLCGALFLSGHWVLGIIVALATVVMYVRSSIRIARQHEQRLRFSYGTRYKRYSLRERFGSLSWFRNRNES